jgi:anti-sigma regulatory factor (Ser/Thr protein kinase)
MPVNAIFNPSCNPTIFRRKVPLWRLCACWSQLVGTLAASPAICRSPPFIDSIVRDTSMPVQSQVSQRFACAPQAPGVVRRFVSDTLRGWGLDELIDDSALVAAELATNAVAHAHSDVTVFLSQRPHGVRLVVGDANPTLPSIRAPAQLGRGGRGLRIVDAIADRWGYERTPDGKRVWADISGVSPPTTTL